MVLFRTAGLITALAACALIVRGYQEQGPDKGRELVLDVCSTCHELGLLYDRALNREQWSTFIKGMVDEGAAVTEEEFSLIVDYLARNFGPKNSREKNP